MPDTIESLCEEYAVWCFSNALPCMSADELYVEFMETLTPAQKSYLQQFLNRWSNVDA